MQHFGPCGSLLGDRVIRTTVPHNVHRLVKRTFLSSPAGGGAGTGRENPSISFKPILYTTYMNSSEPVRGTTKSTSSTVALTPIRATAYRWVYYIYEESQLSRLAGFKKGSPCLTRHSTR